MATSGCWKVKRAFCCPAPELKLHGPLWRISVFASKNSDFQFKTILSVLLSAGTTNRRNSRGVVGRRENRQNCSALLCRPSVPAHSLSTFSPTLSRPGRAALLHLSALSCLGRKCHLVSRCANGFNPRWCEF